MSSVSPLAVRVRDVRKHYDAGLVRALDGVDLDVRQGEWLAITGPSGCGKSTLLHLLAVLDRPTSGTVEIFGTDVTRLRRPAVFRRTRVGLVFQLHNLLPQLSAAHPGGFQHVDLRYSNGFAVLWAASPAPVAPPSIPPKTGAPPAAKANT